MLIRIDKKTLDETVVYKEEHEKAIVNSHATLSSQPHPWWQ